MVKFAGGARFQAASDQSLLIYFDTKAKAEVHRPQSPGQAGRAKAQPLQKPIRFEAHAQIRRLLRLLELEPIAGVRNVHPAYCSVLIKFDALKWCHGKLEEKLQEYLERLEDVSLPQERLVEIPVCYGGEFGPDLNEVAALHRLTPEQVIELHASTTYLVYFLGFVPGFAYLGELPEALVTPRLATPRRKVPAGSVGIAGSQTGVYPFATPGGWRLLGRTPVAMFRSERDELSLVAIGDHVRFVPISRERFVVLERA